MTKNDCKDCFFLREGDDGEWICDSRDDEISLIKECPETENDLNGHM